MMALVPSNARLNKLSASVWQTLSKRIEQAVVDGITPAVTLAVFHRDTPILEAGWGWLDPETQQIPTQSNTLFDLASVTKLYTTLALLALITEEEASLHSPLMSIIPEFGELPLRPIGAAQDSQTKEMLPIDPTFKGQQVRSKDVTLFHLLTHTSGLPTWRDIYSVNSVPVAPNESDSMTQSMRWQTGLARILDLPFAGLPDSGVRYSSIGLMLLGEVVSRLHGGSLEKAIFDLVLKGRFDRTTYLPVKAGFALTEIAPTEMDATWRKRRLHGEVHDENAAGLGGITGHSGMFSTAFEVALLGNLWLNRPQKMLGIDPELATAATELQAQTGSDLRGLGWMLKSTQDSVAGDLFHPSSYGHTGYTGTSLWIDPKQGLVVSLLSNRIYHGREKVGIHELRRDVHTILHQSIS